MGDRIAVMDQGHIRQLGTPREIYDDPADTFVATFVGSPPMNLVPHDGDLIGFRPEHFTPAEPLLSAPMPRSPSRFGIHREEYLGSEHLFYGEIGETRAVARFPVTVAINAEPGRTYDFAVARQYLKEFDAETGLRLRAGS